MKTFTLITALSITGTAQAAKLSHNLYGEWRENCIRSLDVSAKDEDAPFVMYKMVLGYDGILEHNYSRYTDAKCTKRKSQKREYAKYRVLESHDRKAKILISKDIGDGLIHESIVDIRLSSINRMASKVLSTKIEIDDLLNDNPLAEVDKNAGEGEAIKNLSRYIPPAKIENKKM